MVGGKLNLGGEGFLRDTAIAAHEKALELVSQGYQGVTIKDEQRKILSADEFEQLYIPAKK